MTTQPMGGFSSKKRWPDGAIEDWQNGASYSWIEEKYGRGYSTVAKMIRNVQMLGTKRVVDLEKRKRSGGRKPLHEQKPLGPLHIHVGLKIARYREVENGYSCSDFARLIDSNRLTVRMMELGLHDFSMSELCRISTTLNLSVADLIGPMVSEIPRERPQQMKGL